MDDEDELVALIVRMNKMVKKKIKKKEDRDKRALL